MRKTTVPVAFAATAALITAAVMLTVSNEGRDEWAYKGARNPAW